MAVGPFQGGPPGGGSRARSRPTRDAPLQGGHGLSCRAATAHAARSGGGECWRTQPGVRAARREPGGGQGVTGAGGVWGVGHVRLRRVRILRRGGRRCSSRAAPKTLQQWVVRVRAQACGLCAPRACLRCARTSRHRCTWPPCARLPARAVSSVCSCSFVVGPTSIVKALARLRRRRPPSCPVCRRLCGHALRDRTL